MIYFFSPREKRSNRQDRERDACSLRETEFVVLDSLRPCQYYNNVVPWRQEPQLKTSRISTVCERLTAPWTFQQEEKWNILSAFWLTLCYKIKETHFLMFVTRIPCLSPSGNPEEKWWRLVWVWQASLCFCHWEALFTVARFAQCNSPKNRWFIRS